MAFQVALDFLVIRAFWSPWLSGHFKLDKVSSRFWEYGWRTWRKSEFITLNRSPIESHGASLLPSKKQIEYRNTRLLRGSSPATIVPSLKTFVTEINFDVAIQRPNNTFYRRQYHIPLWILSGSWLTGKSASCASTDPRGTLLWGSTLERLRIRNFADFSMSQTLRSFLPIFSQISHCTLSYIVVKRCNIKIDPENQLFRGPLSV